MGIVTMGIVSMWIVPMGIVTMGIVSIGIAPSLCLWLECNTSNNPVHIK